MELLPGVVFLRCRSRSGYEIALPLVSISRFHYLFPISARLGASVPRHLAVKNRFFSILVQFDDWIAPTEVGVDMDQAYRHLHRNGGAVKPLVIFFKH